MEGDGGVRAGLEGEGVAELTFWLTYDCSNGYPCYWQTNGRRSMRQSSPGKLARRFECQIGKEEMFLLTHDSCTDNGRPVLEVLGKKHPSARAPSLDDPENSVFEDYPQVPEG